MNSLYNENFSTLNFFKLSNGHSNCLNQLMNKNLLEHWIVQTIVAPRPPKPRRIFKQKKFSYIKPSDILISERL